MYEITFSKSQLETIQTALGLYQQTMNYAKAEDRNETRRITEIIQIIDVSLSDKEPSDTTTTMLRHSKVIAVPSEKRDN